MSSKTRLAKRQFETLKSFARTNLRKKFRLKNLPKKLLQTKSQLLKLKLQKKPRIVKSEPKYSATKRSIFITNEEGPPKGPLDLTGKGDRWCQNANFWHAEGYRL